LHLDLDRAHVVIAVERLVGAERGREQPPLRDAIGKFKVVALAEEFAFLLFVGDLARLFFFALFAGGVFLFSLGEAPMYGAAIFELDLALLDLRFLDFELGQSPLGHADGEARRGERGNRSRQHQALR
jgi:hypothetical protein